MLSKFRFPWTTRRASDAPKRRRRAVPTAEDLEGRQLLSTFTVTNTNSSGKGSLSWAIQQVDSSTSATNTINFKLSGSGAHTIALNSPLPPITNPVTIDGANVHLVGSSCSFDGFDVDAPHVTIENFTLGGFNNAVNIQSSYDTVYGCYIGTDHTGRFAVPNNYGVQISGGSYNTIEDDLISANNYDGVEVGAGAFYNIVENCYIGTDYSGRYALGNETGVLIGPRSRLHHRRQQPDFGQQLRWS